MDSLNLLFYVSPIATIALIPVVFYYEENALVVCQITLSFFKKIFSDNNKDIHSFDNLNASRRHVFATSGHSQYSYSTRKFQFRCHYGRQPTPSFLCKFVEFFGDFSHESVNSSGSDLIKEPNMILYMVSQFWFISLCCHGHLMLPGARVPERSFSCALLMDNIWISNIIPGNIWILCVHIRCLHVYSFEIVELRDSAKGPELCWLA